MAKPATDDAAFVSRSKTADASGGSTFSSNRSSSSSAPTLTPWSTSRRCRSVGLISHSPGSERSKSSPAPPRGARLAKAEKHRGGRSRRPSGILPSGHRPGQIERPQPPLLEILHRLCTDRADTASRAREGFRIEHLGQADRAGPEQRVQSHRLRPRIGTEVQGSLLEILVVQQRVPSAEIDELARPSPDGRLDLAQPELGCRIRRSPHFSLSRNVAHGSSLPSLLYRSQSLSTGGIP